MSEPTMKSWWGVAALALGIIAAFFVMRDADGEATPPAERAVEAPEEARRVAAAPAQDAAEAAAPKTPPAAAPAPERTVAPSPEAAPAPTKARTSLVDRAWNERASQEAFGGEAFAESVKYPLTKDGIQSAVRAKKAELQSCYESWQKVQPDLAGRLVTRFEITKDEESDEPVARIREVTLAESELDNVFMEGCVRQVMEELRFDPPESGKLVVNYPLTFSTNEDAAER